MARYAAECQGRCWTRVDGTTVHATPESRNRGRFVPTLATPVDRATNLFEAMAFQVGGADRGMRFRAITWGLFQDRL
jgi:hypothetical protein